MSFSWNYTDSNPGSETAGVIVSPPQVEKEGRKGMREGGRKKEGQKTTRVHKHK